MKCIDIKVVNFFICIFIILQSCVYLLACEFFPTVSINTMTGKICKELPCSLSYELESFILKLVDLKTLSAISTTNKAGKNLIPGFCERNINYMFNLLVIENKTIFEKKYGKIELSKNDTRKNYEVRMKKCFLV